MAASTNWSILLFSFKTARAALRAVDPGRRQIVIVCLCLSSSPWVTGKGALAGRFLLAVCAHAAAVISQLFLVLGTASAPGLEAMMRLGPEIVEKLV